MQHSVRLTRLASALAVAVVAAPLAVLASPAAAGAATTPATRDRADVAAGWLTRQLDPATHTVLGKFGPDYGLTADVVLALDAAGNLYGTTEFGGVIVTQDPVPLSTVPCEPGPSQLSK